MMRISECLSPSFSVLVLAPHPDDEILGCARLIRLAEDRDCPVVIVWLTDGGASHGPLAPQDRMRLIERRRAEAAQGLSALGVVPTATYHLAYPDGCLIDHIDKARNLVEDICRIHAVGTVVVTDKSDSHPDHKAAYALALGLKHPRHLLSYPVSARFEGAEYAPPDDALCLEASPEDAKRWALLEHRSQMEPSAICPMTLAAIDRFCADPDYFMVVERIAS